MSKIKYKFDQDTLDFKVDKLNKGQKIKKFFLFFVGIIILSIFINSSYTSFYDTPKEKELKRENKIFASKYVILQKEIENVSVSLNDMQRRDDYVYRSVFELDPIAANVRNAGFGGVNRFADLEGYNNSDVMIETAKKLDKISRKIYIQSKSFDEVIDISKKKEEMLECIPAIQPVSIDNLARISDYFGYRKDPFTGQRRKHNGMDFAGTYGSNIYATGNGKVIEARYTFHGYGKKVVINHGFGYITIYGHMRKIKVKVGDIVKRGQIIGELGSTGRSTGPHLHYEIRKNNVPINPINYYFNDISAKEYDTMIAVMSKNRKPMD